MYVQIIVQHEFRDAFLVLSRRRRPTNCWILSFRIGIGITKSFQFDVSAYTIRCDGRQFCILKAMGFGIEDTISPSDKCNKEGPILCLGSPSSPVNWNYDGIARPINNKGSGRPAGPMPKTSPTPTTTSPGPTPTTYGQPVMMTMIATGFRF